MKYLLFLVLLASSSFVAAEEATAIKPATATKNEWKGTTLNEATIKTIQQAQYTYKKCVTTEMQKEGYLKIESRSATDAIIKQCEDTLSKLRKDYLAAGVPGEIADRHLKKLRTDITRRVLKQLMFAEAMNQTK